MITRLVWFVFGFLVGALALFVFMNREKIGDVVKNRGKIAGAASVLEGLEGLGVTGWVKDKFS